MAMSRASRIPASAGRLLMVSLALLGLVPAASAQGKIDQALLMKYGGVLAPECGNYLLPQLKYLGDSLVVQDGGKPLLTGRDPKVAPNYFGASPPPEFESALTSLVSGGDALVFVFYRNATGVYAAVAGGPKTLAALPRAFTDGTRVRHCDPNRNRVAGTGPPAEPGPPELLRDAKFRQPYLRALGPLASSEDWLTALDGPAPPVTKVTVAGTSYQLVHVCKNHDCFDNNLTLLYAPGTVFARLQVRGKPTRVGAPPPAVAGELDRLWQGQWRSQR
jgi:hypothetical protein